MHNHAFPTVQSHAKSLNKMPMWNPKCLDLPLSEEQQQRLLQKFDFDKDGRLSKKDLELGLRQMGLRFCRWRAGRALRHADLNKDRYISKDEINELVKYATKWGLPAN
ncbi:hypothetical protein CK203_081457 [Vitis vinifera]|uniref:EF-hand domain-containing protein n=1 Tax=Vitis vinifera TaxID=29760 RepID=A0A438DYL6_VITVI|nr:hypothetical protein CK203_081457 [Vitis vinifera]